MAILYTFGISDAGTSQIRPDARGNMNFFANGCCSVLGMLDLGAIREIPLVLYGPNAEQPPLRLPQKPSLIFNQIAEPDSHSTALERAVTLCDAMGVPVINDPRKVQKNSRDQVSELLQGIDGVTMPRTYRVQPRSPDDVLQAAKNKELDFPFIFRSTGEHNGANMVRIDSAEDVARLHAFALDGRDHYLIEYIDYADDDGVYYKCRICFVDGAFFVQHASFNRDWIVHMLARGARDFQKAHPELGNIVQLMTEIESTRLPKAKAALTEINRRIGLDYLSLDCHIDDDGHVLVFEANANTNALENPQEGTGPFIEKIRAAVRQLIIERSGEDPGAARTH